MKLDQQSLLQIIDLLTELTVYEKLGFEEFLEKVIVIVDKIIPRDSVLIYVADRSNKELVLAASKNPKSELIGKLKLKNTEGITGWVAEHRRSLAISEKAYTDKRFKRIAELPEDKFEAFLSVPIIGGDGLIGVINLQNKSKTDYSKAEIKLLESIGKLVSAALKQTLLNQKVIELQDEIATKKLVDHAKALLIKDKNITENQAHRLLQKEAMNRRKSLRDIAEAVILVFQDVK